MAFMAFDVLEFDGRRVMREPWRDRRKRPEDLFGSVSLPRAGLVPVTEDAAARYETWVDMGGEGVVPKDQASLYRPGIRSPARLKLKPKLTLDVVVTGGSAARVAWGDWGEAVLLDLRYTHLRTGSSIEIRQAVRVPRDQPFELILGRHAELVCWGIKPSGMLRHPLWLGYS